MLQELILCYNIQAGKGEQRQDLSWWPKVTTFEGSGLNVGCWTPMCENWFKKRSEGIHAGRVGPNSSIAWQKNLKYAKETKKFVKNSMDLAERFLVDTCQACHF